MAIDDLLDEHEQGERVRSWLQRNALGLLGGVALGLALIGGLRWYEARNTGLRVADGGQYQLVLGSIAANDLAKAQAALAKVGDNVYRTLGALALARAQVLADKPADAIAVLQAATRNDAGLADVRNQRLARLLIDTGKGADAVTLLAAAADATGLEIRGDAAFALGRMEQARTDYTAALARLDVAAPQRRLLELKLTQAGGMPAQSEART